MNIDVPVIILTENEAKMVYALLYESYQIYAVGLKPNSTVCSLIKKISAVFNLEDWTEDGLV